MYVANRSYYHIDSTGTKIDLTKKHKCIEDKCDVICPPFYDTCYIHSESSDLGTDIQCERFDFYEKNKRCCYQALRNSNICYLHSVRDGLSTAPLRDSYDKSVVDPKKMVNIDSHSETHNEKCPIVGNNGACDEKIMNGQKLCHFHLFAETNCIKFNIDTN
jgi:hypothetical protein